MFDIINNPLSVLYTLPGILIGLVIHEFSHAAAATALGDDTPTLDGRLSLNPLHHLDPIGTIMIILLRFGWAKPVRVNPSKFKNPRSGMLIVALAGPFSNLLLAFLFSCLFTSLVYVAGIENEALQYIIYYAYTINIMLFAFNLLPLPPLDGFNLVTTIFTNIKTQVIWQLRRYGIIIIIALSFFGILGIYISFVLGLVDGAFEFIKSFIF